MKQKAHSWVALRALKLIEDSRKAPKLSELLFYYLADVWEGAWIPDSLVVDMAYGHTFKMDSDAGIKGIGLAGQDWLRVNYRQLDTALAGKRLCLDYIQDSPELQKPYRSHPRYGGHLPNRVIALSHTIGDMLKLGDFPLSFYTQAKRKRGYKVKDASGADLSAEPIKNLSLSPNFSARQVALMFFMISHYICDVHMPLHCDLRDSAEPPCGRRIPATLHPSIEEQWEVWFPSEGQFAAHVRQRKSLDDAVLDLPRGSLIKIDTDPSYQLDEGIRNIKQDEWQEMVYVARISYALSRKWIAKPYQTVREMIADASEDEFVTVSNFIFHDAVESVARIWYKAWQRFRD